MDDPIKHQCICCQEHEKTLATLEPLVAEAKQRMLVANELVRWIDYGYYIGWELDKKLKAAGDDEIEKANVLQWAQNEGHIGTIMLTRLALELRGHPRALDPQVEKLIADCDIDMVRRGEYPGGSPWASHIIGGLN